MNDSTHNSAVEVLRSRKDSWNEWRRVENGSDQITLAGEDLSEMDIEGVDLSGLDARDVDLYGSNLMSSNLKMTNLAKADLSYANLGNIGGYKLCLEGAHLMEANLDR